MSSLPTDFATTHYEVRRWPERREFYVVDRETGHMVGSTFRNAYQAQIWALRIQSDRDAGRHLGIKHPPVSDVTELNGVTLRERREAMMFSQARLAAELGVSENTVARWERGALTINNPRMLTLALDALKQRAQLDGTGL